MILIASAAYVNSEFQVEFGRLPPSFLPIGNVRLFERQIQVLRRRFPDENVYLSLPASYELPPKDARYLDLNNISILRSDEHLRLSDAIAFALNKVSNPSEGLRLLHGDTLLVDIPAELDVIGVVETDDDYAWEVEKFDSHSEFVWCGYFSFSDANLFKEKLRSTEDGFVSAVRQYDRSLPMKRKDIGYWYDFGHINTYFQSRARMTTERAFNSLTIKDGCVRKTGRPFEKISAEANWFIKLPASLRSFCPQFIETDCDAHGHPYYSLEYLPLPALNDVFVHGKNPAFFWHKIFKLCDDFMTRCNGQQLDEEAVKRITVSASKLAKEKTNTRLQEFCKQAEFIGFDVPMSLNGEALPTLRYIIEHCLCEWEQSTPKPGVSHGDFCLSNILFDSRSDRIKVIDPRGLDANGELTIVGDLRYDLAKLTHSVIGLYDHIISGAFDVHTEMQSGTCAFKIDIPIDERIVSIQELFLSRTYIGNLKPREVMPLTILLFFSMLPLHADNPHRQLGFFANALRLYAKFIKNENKS